MGFREWDELPEFMRNKEVRKYYNSLKRKRFSLLLKRFFDVFLSVSLLMLLSPVFLFISVWIKTDSSGPVFYRQERVTQYGKVFRIFKFRTMVEGADQKGALLTAENDVRVTKVGKKIRKYRIDEIPQLLNILTGDMSFVGTRPEVRKYVDAYTDEMKATLLLPAGVTSKTSIRYRDEDRILKDVEDIDGTYIQRVLPEKMKWNLKALKKFSLFKDFCIIIETIFAVIFSGKGYV